MKRALISTAVALAFAACFAACSDSSDGNSPSTNVTPDGGGDSTDSSSSNDAATDPGNEPDAEPDVTTPPPPKVDVTTESITVDGTPRQYVLAVPKNYDATRSYPLILVLHGDGGDGPSMRAGHTVDEVSGEDAIVAYPTGINAGWNQSLDVPNNPDMHFMTQLVDALKGRYSIDAGRVFGVGYSSGAFMLNQISCVMSMFRGIASHAGGAPYDTNGAPVPDCSGGSPIAAIIFHGDADPSVPVDTDYAAQYWAQRAGCAGDTSPTTPSPCQAYNSCPSDKPVEICVIPGLGHIPWSEGVEAEWAFFQALP